MPKNKNIKAARGVKVISNVYIMYTIIDDHLINRKLEYSQVHEVPGG